MPTVRNNEATLYVSSLPSPTPDTHFKRERTLIDREEVDKLGDAGGDTHECFLLKLLNLLNLTQTHFVSNTLDLIHSLILFK